MLTAHELLYTQQTLSVSMATDVIITLSAWGSDLRSLKYYVENHNDVLPQ